MQKETSERIRNEKEVYAEYKGLRALLIRHYYIKPLFMLFFFHSLIYSMFFDASFR